MSEILKLIGIIFFSGIIIYIIITLFKAQSGIVEGMTNETTTTATSTGGSGEAGSAANYAEKIKAQVVKIQDELLISKYRKDYENTIIHLNDLVGMMMIKQVQNMKAGDQKEVVTSLNSLNILKQAKESLNATMKFLDGQ